MNTSILEEIATNELVRTRLAELMALECFRNTRLEDFHEGTYPASQSGDYSDVKVVTPFGEIPWREVSRLSDDDMKLLMIDVTNHCHNLAPQRPVEIEYSGNSR